MSWLDVVLGRSGGVLGLNRRNLAFVYPKNPRWAFALADDKLRAKEALIAAGVPVAPTLAVFDSFHQLAGLEAALASVSDFVVKPARGRAGRGVLVVVGRTDDGGFVRAGGERLALSDLRRHVADLIFGVYSLDRADCALFEPRLAPSPFFAALAPTGLADIRIICVDEQPAVAMIRAPTRASEGRANIHQGAMGVAVELETGRLRGGWHAGGRRDTHVDTGQDLTDGQVPGWAAIVDMARQVAKLLPLKYVGLDIVVDKTLGPLILEFNARPGLEIQNVVGAPLLDVFAAVGARPGEGARP